jgi:hemoglobin-like flavoprotein
LNKGLGDAFTPDIRAAWIKVYNALAAMMQAGAAEAAAIRVA